MLIATAAFAAVAALSTLVGLGELVVLVAGLGLLYVVPVALGTIAVYSRSMRRTFFAGAFAGSLASHYMHWHLEWGDSIFQALILVGLAGMTSVCCGLTAWISRRFVERRGWHLPSSDQGD